MVERVDFERGEACNKIPGRRHFYEAKFNRLTVVTCGVMYGVMYSTRKDYYLTI